MLTIKTSCSKRCWVDVLLVTIAYPKENESISGAKQSEKWSCDQSIMCNSGWYPDSTGGADCLTAFHFVVIGKCVSTKNQQFQMEHGFEPEPPPEYNDMGPVVSPCCSWRTLIICFTLNHFWQLARRLEEGWCSFLAINWFFQSIWRPTIWRRWRR